MAPPLEDCKDPWASSVPATSCGISDVHGNPATVLVEQNPCNVHIATLNNGNGELKPGTIAHLTAAPLGQRR